MGWSVTVILTSPDLLVPLVATVVTLDTHSVVHQVESVLTVDGPSQLLHLPVQVCYYILS